MPCTATAQLIYVLDYHAQSVLRACEVNVDCFQLHPLHAPILVHLKPRLNPGLPCIMVAEWPTQPPPPPTKRQWHILCIHCAHGDRDQFHISKLHVMCSVSYLHCGFSHSTTTFTARSSGAWYCLSNKKQCNNHPPQKQQHHTLHINVHSVLTNAHSALKALNHNCTGPAMRAPQKIRPVVAQA